MGFNEIIQEEISMSKNNWNNKIHGSGRLTPFQIRQIFAIKHEVNLERDANGNPLPGTGRIITQEEKKLVLDYILENDYPLTKRIYNVVLEAYLDGEIELSQIRKL